MSNNYPVVRYQFTFEVTEAFRLSDYAGSMLRGLFGWSLKKLSIASKFGDVISQRELYRLCPYTMLFEPPPPETHRLQNFSSIPAPYVIEPPDWGSRELEPGDFMQFNMVLAGHARHQLPYVILAWKGALYHKIGWEEGGADLVEVCRIDGDILETIYHRDDPAIVDHETTTDISKWSSNGADAGDVTLNVITPMRLQCQGEPLRPGEVTARTFLMALIRRIGLITEFHTNLDLHTDFGGLSGLADGIA
ncbi:MAG: hypothetical protein QF437_18330, partial [Planctomycetota bacterium]|nr:hypothetical protein [Planctomycetota bacterium]